MLNNLPRDTRDTLFLLALIGWVVALLSSHLPLWCTGLTAAVLLWRGTLTWRGQPLPSRGWRLGLLALTVAATFYTHKTILGRDAGVTLIVVLLALKTLELRARRDAFVVFFLALFTLLTHFFYSQSLLTAAGILLAVWGLLTGLVNAHMPAGKPPLWHAARVAGGMALLGAPIMVVLFLFFPRIAPLWGVPGEMAGRTGLSDTMKVGSVATLAQDESVALRVKFNGAVPNTSQLYFRGPVLGQFDGREWRAMRSRLPEVHQLEHQLKVSGPPLNYEVTLEPTNRPWVMVLDAAPKAPQIAGRQLTLTPELQWLSNKALTDLVRYRATSYPQFQHGPMDNELGLQDYLELPPGFNPQTMALAQQWRKETGYRPAAAPQLVQRALDQLRTGGYQYTLSPGLYGTHSADEFWFERKQGFCEHIAAAFVVLMRSMDIPARIVTGYQGGAQNPLDGYVTVRQSDAHAWAEVWLPRQGWVRVDPTASVAPSRTLGVERLQAPQSAVRLALGSISPELGARLRATWDAVNNRWNQWVLNYTQNDQFNLLKNLGFESPSWSDLGYVLAALLTTASLAGAAWTLWERMQHDPWLRLLQTARKKARAAGLLSGPDSTPRQLAMHLQQGVFATHADTPRLVDWLHRFEQHRYAPPGHAQPTLKELQRQFRALRWPHLPTPKAHSSQTTQTPVTR